MTIDAIKNTSMRTIGLEENIKANIFSSSECQKRTRFYLQFCQALYYPKNNRNKVGLGFLSLKFRELVNPTFLTPCQDKMSINIFYYLDPSPSRLLHKLHIKTWRVGHFVQISIFAAGQPLSVSQRPMWGP